MGHTAALDDVDLLRDRVLVEAAQSGDPTAFAELYTRYFNRLVRFAAKRVGDTHEAEEVAQEAFVRAYRALPNFDGERRFYPWMTVIAGRLCVDALRRRGRVEVGEVVDETFLDLGFERLDRQGDIDRVNAAMTRLTDRHREILELREREGWSYQHIAEHLEVSLGTVEALLWRARKALRREFTSLGAAVLCLPGVRRLAVRNQSQPTGALAALGSLGTAVALSLGTWGGVAAASPSSAVRMVSSPAPATAGPSALQGAAAAPAVASVRGAVTTQPDTSATPHTVAPVTPAIGVRFMDRATAAQQAESSPIVIAVPGNGPVVGVDPLTAVNKTARLLGGSK